MVNAATSVVIQGGITPYLGLNRQYVYNYPTSDSSPDSEIDINTISENDVRRFYGGTVNVAAGISHLIKKKNQFEVALFYEKSIGKAVVRNKGSLFYKNKITPERLSHK